MVAVIDQAIADAASKATATGERHTVLFDLQSRVFVVERGRPPSRHYWFSVDGRPIVATANPDGTLDRP